MSKFRQYDKYEVYPDGRIWSYWTNKWLKPGTKKDGYQIVALCDNEGKKKSYLLHRIVYETFSGSPIPNNLQCNHISEDKTDNRFCNINLMTPKENCNFGTRNKRLSKVNTNNPKLSKSVGAYKNDKLVMIFQSLADAQRNGFNQGNVSMCCNGKLPHYKGYTWRYI